MSLLRSLSDGLRSLFRKERVEGELDEELRSFLELAAEEKIKEGMSGKEALRAVRLERGNLEVAKEIVRTAAWESFVETLWQDLRFGVRMLRKNPGFAAVAVLTVTLGIGATAAIFSVVDAVLLRSLPYRDPNRLVSLYEDRSSTGFPRKEFTPANYADCKEQKQIFEDVAAIDADRFYNLTSNGAAPEKLSAEGVSWNLFSMLGTSPLLGRVFRPEEDVQGADHVVLISHRLWRGRFGGDPNVVGQDILLNGEKYSVIGVMPAGFSFPTKNADLWVPITFTPQGLAMRGAHFLTVIAALQSGVSVARSNAELSVFSQNLRQQHMDIMRFVDSFVAVPLQEVYTQDVRGGLTVLLAAVGFILLIACANIANLLLSRSAIRQREIAIRSALGANRARLVCQLLTESALISAAGAVLGLLLAEGSFSFLRNLIPEDISRTVSLTLNLSVLTFAVVISFASAFLFGLAPALQISRIDLNDSLKEGGRGNAEASGKGLGNLLVVGEIALSLLLLVASGLLLESFVKLRRGDPGFRSDHVLTLGIPVPQTENPDFFRRSQFFQTILERVRALPGVRIAGVTSVLPLTWKSGMAAFLPDGVVQPDVQYGALDRVVSPGYFEAMRIPLLRGRLFDDHDGPDAPSAAVINETMARKFWPNEDPLGKRFKFNLVGGNFRLFQIVGIVGDVRQMGLNAPPKEEMYFPHWQANGNYMVPSTLVVRTTSDPESLVSAVREAVWSVDPNQPVSDVLTMDDVLDREVAQTRVQAVLLGGLAALALTLASVGIYGVMAYLVMQQTREIGVRVALGAQPRDILGLVLGRGTRLTLMGVGVGVAAALLTTGLMRSLLFGVSPMDPLTIASVAVLLTFVALLASYIPARRAMRIDPMVALKYE